MSVKFLDDFESEELNALQRKPTIFVGGAAWKA